MTDDGPTGFDFEASEKSIREHEDLGKTYVEGFSYLWSVDVEEGEEPQDYDSPVSAQYRAAILADSIVAQVKWYDELRSVGFDPDVERVTLTVQTIESNFIEAGLHLLGLLQPELRSDIANTIDYLRTVSQQVSEARSEERNEEFRSAVKRIEDARYSEMIEGLKRVLKEERGIEAVGDGTEESPLTTVDEQEIHEQPRVDPRAN